ncbi:MAG TPA: pyrimidine 5'-nucleotidase [Methylibium sp.]|uniref:pyrimidine 5'-nucleotidase n=1 Tax=Methylibium sp. TaxID=2067992 RepID=UPI002DB5B4BC|nr:pyrimidine 5'-nucleotidase [Methylibium sp.]HEU4458376.1 pyrimidine 5'-nucleotidase [Methylibium sp.]
MRPSSARAWLFDLDNTLHDASHRVMALLDASMNAFIAEALAVDEAEADRLRRDYWRRFGATLSGLERLHGVKARDFIEAAHRLPELQAALRWDRRDVRAVRELAGRKILVTNAHSAYAVRVLRRIGLARSFEAVIGIDHMRMFGTTRPKPDSRMFRRLLARLKLPASRCVLVEDTLAHQRAARSVGLATVWMQAHLKRNAHGPEVGARLRRRPAYVHARIRALRALHGLSI